MFDDDISGSYTASLIPEDMIAKCRTWCAYYVEQLRCWELLVQAAEIEKICSMTCLRDEARRGHKEGAKGVVAMSVSHRTEACSICSIAMQGAQFFCPGCLHSSHLACLDEYIEVLCAEDGESFVCPTGCGCECANVPVAAVQWVKEVAPKKKASFTDPRRWRARVEGDS